MKEESSVASLSVGAQQMASNLAVVRALMGGTAAMRKAGAALLPKWPNEDPEAYKTRLSVSTLFPAYSRTVMTLASKPFSKPVTYGEDVPTDVREWLESDADLQGRNLDAFAACVTEEALAYGLSGILVDYPRVQPGANATQAQERQAGLRPYLVHIHPWNILGWRSQRINGSQMLVQLRLMEVSVEPDGEFGEKEVQRIRVLEPGKVSIYAKNETTQKWELSETWATTIDFIPFVPVYGGRVDFMVGSPPMLEMAHLNVKHWQSQSDQDNILHVSRVPILYVAGVDDDAFSMTVGASAAVKLPMGASAGFIEHSGSALGAGRTSLEDLKEEMRQAGAELLVLQPGAITATQVASENAVGMCALQRIVESVEDSLGLCLDYMVRWVRAGDDGGSVTLFKDFGAATLAEASAQLLLDMRRGGELSKATLLSEVKRRGILSADVDVEKELEAAAADGPDLNNLGGGGPNDGGGGA